MDGEKQERKAAGGIWDRGASRLGKGGGSRCIREGKSVMNKGGKGREGEKAQAQRA